MPQDAPQNNPGKRGTNSNHAAENGGNISPVRRVGSLGERPAIEVRGASPTRMLGDGEGKQPCRGMRRRNAPGSNHTAEYGGNPCEGAIGETRADWGGDGDRWAHGRWLLAVGAWRAGGACQRTICGLGAGGKRTDAARGGQWRTRQVGARLRKIVCADSHLLYSGNISGILAALLAASTAIHSSPWGDLNGCRNSLIFVLH
jgi:hypothetical protein